MEEMKIMYYINPGKSEARAMYIKDNLDVFHELIECDYIDITTRTIGGVTYDIICDDEALLKSNPIISAVSETRTRVAMLYGSLLIAKPGNDGELHGLMQEDVDNIEKHVLKYLDFSVQDGSPERVCVEMDY